MTIEELREENEILKQMVVTKDAVNKQFGKLVEDLERRLRNAAQNHEP